MDNYFKQKLSVVPKNHIQTYNPFTAKSIQRERSISDDTSILSDDSAKTGNSSPHSFVSSSENSSKPRCANENSTSYQLMSASEHTQKMINVGEKSQSLSQNEVNIYNDIHSYNNLNMPNLLLIREYQRYKDDVLRRASTQKNNQTIYIDQKYNTSGISEKIRLPDDSPFKYSSIGNFTLAPFIREVLNDLTIPIIQRNYFYNAFVIEFYADVTFKYSIRNKYITFVKNKYTGVESRPIGDKNFVIKF